MKKAWAVRKDGEILFSISGPDAEALARAAAQNDGGVLVYRDEGLRPTAENGWQLWGPWQEAA